MSEFEKLMDDMDTIGQKPIRSAKNPIAQEVEQYFSNITLGQRIEDPLMWWSVNKEKF